MTNWELINAIIQIVGTITVIVTLIYVAIQINQNSKQLEQNFQATKTQSWHAINENFQRWRDMVLSADNSDIWIRGINNLDDLDRNEHMKFNMIAGTFIWTIWEHYHLMHNEGLLNDVNSHIFTDLYKHNGFRTWLINHEKYHTDDFGTFLKSVREAVGDERYKFGEASSLTSSGVY
jgi:hypothetical protein